MSSTASTPELVSEVAELPKLYDRRPTVGRAWIQRTLAWLLLLPFCGLLVLLIRLSGRYSIEGMPELRREYRRITSDKSPLLICANHLTFIDSALLIWALGSNFWYLFNYHAFSWNLPAGDFFKKKLRFRAVAYLTKCIYIHRDGTKDHHRAVLELCRNLLKRGEVVTIFPEGRRSRTGRIEMDQLTYGAGKILAGMESCRVLCVYLRGEHQETYSNYPRKGSRFKMEYRLLNIVPEGEARTASYEATQKIASTLKQMEQDYFSQKAMNGVLT